MRTGELKVYRGAERINGKQVHVIVAATSQRTAVAALANFGIGISVRHLVTYWSVTSNSKECEIAMLHPGQAFASSSTQDTDFAPLPRRSLPPPAPVLPRVPKDPEARKEYDKRNRENSDSSKRARGERRLSTWIPKEAAEALDKLTGGDTTRGAVQAALVQAILFSASRQDAAKAA